MFNERMTMPPVERTQAFLRRHCVMFEIGGPPSSSLQKEERVSNITIYMLPMSRILNKVVFIDVD